MSCILTKFLRLAKYDKLLFLEAVIVLTAIKTALLIFSFKKLTSSLLVQSAEITPPAITDEQAKIAGSVAAAIKRAVQYTPWQSTCLTQALAAWRMLNKRKIPGTFYLGVAKSPEDGQMAAHAWSQCGSDILTGKEEKDEFKTVSSHSWGKNDSLRHQDTQ